MDGRRAWVPGQAAQKREAHEDTVATRPSRSCYREEASCPALRPGHLVIVDNPAAPEQRQRAPHRQPESASAVLGSYSAPFHPR